MPHRTRPADGALLIGPFDLKREGVAEEEEATAAADGGDEADGDGAACGVLPPELFLALQVVAMQEAGDEEEMAISLDEIELLRQSLGARLQPLLPTEASDAAAAAGQPGPAAFAAHYRDGQRRILRAALDEVDALAGGAGEEEGEEEEN